MDLPLNQTWCDECHALRQSLMELKTAFSHQANIIYGLKEKIIPTDQLITDFYTKQKENQDLMKNLEISKRHCEELGQQLRSNLAQLEPLRENKEKLERHLQRYEVEIERLNAEVDAFRISQQQLKVAHDKMQEKLKKSEEEKKESQTSLRKTESRLKKCQDELAARKKENSELKKENTALQNEMKKLKLDLDRHRNEALQGSKKKEPVCSLAAQVDASRLAVSAEHPIDVSAEYPIDVTEFDDIQLDQCAKSELESAQMNENEDLDISRLLESDFLKPLPPMLSPLVSPVNLDLELSDTESNLEDENVSIDHYADLLEAELCMPEDTKPPLHDNFKEADDDCDADVNNADDTDDDSDFVEIPLSDKVKQATQHFTEPLDQRHLVSQMSTGFDASADELALSTLDACCIHKPSPFCVLGSESFKLSPSHLNKLSPEFDKPFSACSSPSLPDTLPRKEVKIQPFKRDEKFSDIKQEDGGTSPLICLEVECQSLASAISLCTSSSLHQSDPLCSMLPSISLPSSSNVICKSSMEFPSISTSSIQISDSSCIIPSQNSLKLIPVCGELIFASSASEINVISVSSSCNSSLTAAMDVASFSSTFGTNTSCGSPCTVLSPHFDVLSSNSKALYSQDVDMVSNRMSPLSSCVHGSTSDNMLLSCIDVDALSYSTSDAMLQSFCVTSLVSGSVHASSSCVTTYSPSHSLFLSSSGIVVGSNTVPRCCPAEVSSSMSLISDVYVPVSEAVTVTEVLLPSSPILNKVPGNDANNTSLPPSISIAISGAVPLDCVNDVASPMNVPLLCNDSVSASGCEPLSSGITPSDVADFSSCNKVPFIQSTFTSLENDGLLSLSSGKHDADDFSQNQKASIGSVPISLEAVFKEVYVLSPLPPLSPASDFFTTASETETSTFLPACHLPLDLTLTSPLSPISSPSKAVTYGRQNEGKLLQSEFGSFPAVREATFVKQHQGVKRKLATDFPSQATIANGKKEAKRRKLCTLVSHELSSGRPNSPILSESAHLCQRNESKGKLSLSDNCFSAKSSKKSIKPDAMCKSIFKKEILASAAKENSERAILSRSVPGSEDKPMVQTSTETGTVLELLRGMQQVDSSSSKPLSDAEKSSTNGLVESLIQEALELEEDWLQMWYDHCKRDEASLDKPLITPTLQRLVMECHKLNDDALREFFSCTLSILSRKDEAAIVSGNMALCCVFVGLCRLQGDVERVRVFVYDAIRQRFFAYISLILTVAAVWPAPLQRKESSVFCPVSDVFQYVVCSKTLTSKPKHQKMLFCLEKLCGWKEPMETVEELAQGFLHCLKQQLQKPGASCKALIWNVKLSFDLLAVVEEWQWANNFVVVQLLWPVLSSWAMNPAEAENQTFIKAVIGILGHVMCHCPATCKSNTDQILDVLLALLQESSVAVSIQLSVLQSLLLLAKFQPERCTTMSRQWIESHQNDLDSVTVAMLHESVFSKVEIPNSFSN